MGMASEIAADGSQSMRKMAKELNVSEIVIRKAMDYLGAFSYVREWPMSGNKIVPQVIRPKRPRNGARRTSTPSGHGACGPCPPPTSHPWTLMSGAPWRGRPAASHTTVWTP